MKYFFTIVLFFSLAAWSAVAQGPAPKAKPGIVPGGFLFFFDRLGEAFQEFFTFNPEAKVKLQVAFAAERVAEIEVILEAKGVDAPGLDIAQTRLQDHMEHAAKLLENEKSKGKDVSKLASEVDDDFDAQEKNLDQIYEAKEKALEAKIDELETRLKAARTAGDTQLINQLEAELATLEAEKQKLEDEKDAIEESLESQEDAIEDQMEANEKEQEQIEEEKEKANEAADETEKIENELESPGPEIED